MHCSLRGRFIQAYQDIARKLNLPGCDGPQSDTARLVSEWLSEASNGVWLMILDNADDLDIFFSTKVASVSKGATFSPLISYVPRTSHGLIVITTRDRRLGERLADREPPVTLGPMPSIEAEMLLRSRMNAADSSDEDDSQCLLEALEFLPLGMLRRSAAFHSFPPDCILPRRRTPDSSLRYFLKTTWLLHSASEFLLEVSAAYRFSTCQQSSVRAGARFLTPYLASSRPQPTWPRKVPV